MAEVKASGKFRVAPEALAVARRIAGPALVYEAGWKLATLFLLGPITTALLNASIALGWEGAVTNEALLEFGISPLGIATLAAFGILTLAILYFEQAGLVILALAAARGGRASAREVARVSVRDLPKLVGIAAIEVSVAGLCVAPFVALIGLTYWLLLSGTDINFYLATRPPRFLVAVVIAGALALGAAVVLAYLFIRWVFAVPASLFEGHSPKGAVLASARLVRGRGWRVFGAVVAWQAGKLAAFGLLALGLDFASGAVIDAVGTTNRTVVLGTVAFLMVANGGVFALVSMADLVGFGVLVTVLYEDARAALDEPAARPLTIPRPGAIRVPDRRRRIAVVLGGVAVVGLVTAGEALLVVRKFVERRPVTITAHRAGPRPAPENSIAALIAGITAGADYAEIDVQKTADGVIVVLHDEDLRRLAGVARPIRSMTYEEVKSIDIGSPIGPRFAGERVATLDEFITTAKGRIRLNIELKYYGHDPTLARDVVALLHRRDFAAEVIISSLDPRGLAEVRRLDPTIRLGSIVSARIGDVTRLDLDFLSLRHGLITPALVRQARRRGLEVHAWTIDDRELAVSMIDRGADDLITDDPVMARRARDWHHGLSDPELVLLRFRDWLGSATFRKVVQERRSALDVEQ